MKKINTGLTEEERSGTVKLLNHLMADEMVLYIRTRKYHWNITGMQFRSLHGLFEEQYNALEEQIDDIAERTRALGHYAIGSLKQFQEYSRLQDEREDGNAVNMLKNLLADHESIISQLRIDLKIVEEEFGDTGTSDFMTSLLEGHEKMAWMLRSYLEN